MKLRKSIVLVLVFSLIVTTGIITLASERSSADEPSISKLDTTIQFTDFVQPDRSKKQINTASVVPDGKKVKPSFVRVAKPPADGPQQQGGGTINYGDTVSGEITAVGGQDQWTFMGSTGDLVVINMDSDAFDTFLELQLSGEMVASNDDYNGLNSQIGPISLSDDGVYTIIARPLSETATGAYTLALNTSDIEILTYGDTVTGELSANDSATWAFEGNDDDIVSIRVAGETFSPSVELRDPSGNWLDSGDGTDGEDAVVGPVALTSDGLFVIRVFGYGIFDDTPAAFEITLKSVEVQSLEGGEMAYGNSITTTITNGATHTWTFDGQRGDLIVIDITGASVYPEVEILRPDGLRLVDSTYGIYYEQYGPMVLPFDGTYSMNVTSISDGIYTLQLEQEGTDTPGTGGGVIAYNETQSGTYGRGAPELWTFEGSEGDAVKIVVESSLSSVTVTILNSNGDFIASDGNYDGATVEIGPFVLNQSDTYSVSIASYDNAISGDYSINLEFSGQPEPGGGEIVYNELQSSVLVGGLEDFWTFEGNEGDVVVIFLNSDDFDAFLRLVDVSGQELSSNDDFIGLNSKIGPFTLPADGTYTVVASALGEFDGGEYMLIVQQPNFNEIAYGDTQTSQLEQGTADFWTFDATETDIVRVSVTSEDFEPVVSLMNTAGEDVSYSPSFEGGTVIDATIAETGTYTISVASYVTENGGQYQITLEIRGRVEIGDGFLEYGNIESGLLSVGGRDEWTFEAVAGDVVTIAMNSTELDSFLELIGPDGIEIARNDDSDGLNSKIGPIALTEDGTYTIIARSYSETGTGSYTISLESEETVEPDADEIGYNLPVDGFAVAGSVDQWTFGGRFGDLITIDMIATDFDPYLELYDPSGQRLASNDDFDGLNSRLGPLTLTSDGVYTIAARGLTRGEGGTYTIELHVDQYVFTIDGAGGGGSPQTGGGVLTYGESVVAELEEGNRDEWVFDGTQGDIITIALESDDFDPVLELYNASNTQIARNDDFEGTTNSQIAAFELPSDGTFTIVARAFGNSASGEYTLSLSLDENADSGDTDSGTDDTTVIDNTNFVAGDGILIYGETEASELAAGAQDIYTFDGAAGDVVTVVVNSEDFDTWVELRRLQGSLLTYNNDADGTNAIIVAQELPTDNTYQVIVKGASREDAGAYTVTLMLDDGTVVVDTNDPPESNFLSIGDTVTGELEAGARDEWLFRGQSGTAVTISMTSSEFDGVLELQGTNGRELTRDDDSGGNSNPQIGPYVLPTNGQYTIIARAFSTSESGQYTLSIEETEMVVGGEIEFAQTQTGDLVAGDQQEWTFAGQAGDMVQINVISEEFDTYLELKDSSGIVLMSNDDYNGLNSQIGPYTLPSDGDYVIVVSAYSDTEAGSYTLNVNLIESTPIAYDETIEGSLDVGAMHIYEFDGQEGDVVVITMESRRFEPVIELYANDVYVVAGYNDGDGAEIGPYMLQSDGVYTIRARGAYSDIDEGEYSLHLQQEESVVLGGAIAYGESQSEVLVGGAVSRWEFEGVAGDSVVIAMNSSDFDTYLILEGPNGTQLASNDDYDGLNSQIGPFTLPESGAHAIIAQGYDTTAFGEYTVSLTLQILLGEVVYGTPETRTLEAESSDYWTLNGTTGDIIAISVESEDFIPRIEVRDSSNFMVYSDNNVDGGGALIGPLSIGYSDEYTITINSVGLTGGVYTLLVEEREVVAGSGSLNVGDAVIARLESTDQPRWKFEARSGDTVTVVMSSNDFDTVLSLVDVDGNEIGYNDDFTGLNSQIGPLVLDRTGTYFILPQAFDTAVGGVYTLQLNSGSTISVTTGVLNYGDATTGFLRSGVEDHWTFDATRGDVVVIEMSSDEFDTYLILESGTSIIAYNDDYDGLNSRIGPIAIPADGTYTIVAAGYDYNATGGYNLSLSLQGSGGIDTTNAERIEYNGTVADELSGDRDVWTFEGQSGDNVVITMTSDEIDPYLELYDAEGILLASNDDFDGLNAQIGPYTLPNDGTYAIVASSFGNVDGAYTLTLELSEETSAVDDDIPVGTVVGQRAPNFTLQTIDGEMMSLWDLRGQVVLINFWATWCGPCREEMPDLEIIYQEYQPAGFTIIGVDVEENETLVRDFIAEVPVTFPLLLDDSGDVASLYKIEFFPTSFILNEDGVIERILIGSTNARTLRVELNHIGLEAPQTDE